MSHDGVLASNLVPLEEHGNLVARVDCGLSSEIYQGLSRQKTTFGRPTRVSDMFVSRYGVLGYAEFNISQEVLGGVLLFPKKLSLLVQLLGEDIWTQFKQEYFKGWELEEHVENLKDPRHLGVRFVDEKYYWACRPDYATVGDSMVDQIRFVTGNVIDYLKTLDKGLDTIRGYSPENPSSDFSRLQVRGFLSG